MLDINQAVIHNSLLLGVMVRFPKEAALHSLEATASELGLKLKARAIPTRTTTSGAPGRASPATSSPCSRGR